jgi:hypothetical protein
VTDSSGVITLSPSNSLEKAAQSQLPFPEAWAVKVAQAAILDMNRCEHSEPGLRVRLYLKSSLWEWPGQGWTLNQFEQAFFDYRPCGDEALDALVTGLWQAGLKYRRPFRIEFPGCDQQWVWDGKNLSRQAAAPSPGVRLQVGQPTLSNPNSLLDRLPGIEAARRNAEIHQALREFAFVSPYPINVDALRIDGFQRGPENLWGAYGSSLYTIFARQAESLPALRLGDGTFQKHLVKGQNSGVGWPFWWQAGLEQLRQQAPPQLLVVLGAAASPAHRSIPLEPKLWSSRLVWVYQGIMVEQEEFPLTKGRLRFVAFASAEGMTTDASSLGLIHNEDFLTRRQCILQQLTHWVNDLTQQEWVSELAAGHREDLKARGKSMLKWSLTIGGFYTSIFGWASLIPFSFVPTLGTIVTAIQYFGAPDQARLIVEELNDLGRRWNEYCGPKPGPGG